MPVYLVHGFRWPREGFTGVRVHAIVHNLEDCSVEYIQNENSKRDILDSFHKTLPEQMKELGTLDFIEQYDPDNFTPSAVSQPYAFVADKVVTIAGKEEASDNAQSTPAPLSVNVEDVIAEGPGLTPKAWEALAEIRDKVAEGEKIGWWIVYNGDPERAYDSEDESEEESTPIQETPPVVEAKEGPPVPPKPVAAALPIREKPEQVLPTPTKESIPEPPKLKEAAKSGGFRKKFFGKKT